MIMADHTDIDAVRRKEKWLIFPGRLKNQINFFFFWWHDVDSELMLLAKA